MAAPSSAASSGPAEFRDRTPGQGPVLDAWVRVSLLGLEALTAEAREVLAGVETHLRYAEADGAGTQAS